jgi:hypothetical protein
MIPCQTVSDHLWDWLQDGAGHPLHDELDAHVAGCAGCGARMQSAVALRSTLKSLTDPAPEGFAERLQARLASGGGDSGFEPDPWLEEGESPAPQALVVDRRHPAWWRPVALVASGAAAVLVFGLLARWQATPNGPALPSALPMAEQAAPPAHGDSTRDSLEAVDPVTAETGLLAERPYEGDSSQSRNRQPEGRERLTPVGVAP